MALNEAQIVSYATDEIVQTLEIMTEFQDNAQEYNPPAAELQRSSNTWYKPIEQQSTTVDGWDVSDQQSGVLELSIGGALGDPTGTYTQLRADDTRDETALRRKMKADSIRLLGQVEQRGIDKAVAQGSICLTNTNVIGSSDHTGWDALSDAEVWMNNLELATASGICAYMNLSDYKRAGRDINTSTANYGSNIPDDVYKKGLLQRQIAGVSDVYRHNKIKSLAASTATGIKIDGAQPFKPLANVTAANGSKTPADFRFAEVLLKDATNVTDQDWFTIPGVKAISKDGKIERDDMTFKIVAINASTKVATITPRPIALDDSSLTNDEKAYANVSTSFKDGDDLNFLLIKGGTPNIIMSKDAMVLSSSPIGTDASLFKSETYQSFSAGKVNGVIGFESSLGTLTGNYRIALWYEWQVEKTNECGIFIGGQA